MRWYNKIIYFGRVFVKLRKPQHSLGGLLRTGFLYLRRYQLKRPLLTVFSIFILLLGVNAVRSIQDRIHRLEQNTIQATQRAQELENAKGSVEQQLEAERASNQAKQAEIDKLKAGQGSSSSAPVTYKKTTKNYPNVYAWGNCTWAIANWINVPDSLGHAKYWDNRARALGYKVTSVPKVGAVAQTDAGYYGHVALVITIKGSQVKIKEMNSVGLGIVSYRWITVSSYRYIYF